MSFFLREMPAISEREASAWVLYLSTCDRCARQNGQRRVSEVIAADGVYVCPYCGAHHMLDGPTVRMVRQIKAGGRIP